MQEIEYGGLIDIYWIFKWNESSIKKEKVLKLIPVEPLFGHPNGSKIPTHWLCFMKIPDNKNLNTSNANEIY